MTIQPMNSLISVKDRDRSVSTESLPLIILLVKNPSTNVGPADVIINLNVVKCRYPNCQTPAQPGLELPAVARPADALYWSNDSHWYFATEGFGGSSTFN